MTLAIETLRLDHGATGLSYVLAARLLPAVIFTLAGGVLVDRVPRRLVMLAADVARGAAVTVVTVLVATGGINLTGLVCMALVFGLGDAMFFPAAMAVTPELVPSHLLVGASALNGTSLQLAGALLGPAVGGLRPSVGSSISGSGGACRGSEFSDSDSSRMSGWPAADTIGVRPTLIAGGAIAALTTLIPLLPGVEDPTRAESSTHRPGRSATRQWQAANSALQSGHRHGPAKRRAPDTPSTHTPTVDTKDDDR